MSCCLADVDSPASADVGTDVAAAADEVDAAAGAFATCEDLLAEGMLHYLVPIRPFRHCRFTNARRWVSVGMSGNNHESPR